MASGDKKGKKSKGSKEAKSPPKTREQKQAEKRALALWAVLGTGGPASGAS